MKRSVTYAAIGIVLAVSTSLITCLVLALVNLSPDGFTATFMKFLPSMIAVGVGFGIGVSYLSLRRRPDGWLVSGAILGAIFGMGFYLFAESELAGSLPDSWLFALNLGLSLVAGLWPSVVIRGIAANLKRAGKPPI